MKFWVTYPIIGHPYDPAFLTKDGLTRFCSSGRGGRLFRNWVHRSSRPDRAMAAGGRSRCPRPVRRPRLLRRRHRSVAPDSEHLGAALPQSLRRRQGRRHPWTPCRGGGSPCPSRPAICVVSTRHSGSISRSAMRFSTRPSKSFKAFGARTTSPTRGSRSVRSDRPQTQSRTHIRRFGSVGTVDSPDDVLHATAAAGIHFPHPAPWRRPRRHLRSRRWRTCGPMLDELWQYVEEAGRNPSEIDVSFGSNAGGNPGNERLQPRSPTRGCGAIARTRRDMVRHRRTWRFGRPRH